MSLQWEEWKRQTEAHFRNLDESFLPVDSAEGIHVQAREENSKGAAS